MTPSNRCWSRITTGRDRGKAAIASVAPAATSQAAECKRGRRRNDENPPLSSFPDVMAHLANPTTLQTAAFVLLGIEPMRAQ